MDLGHQPQQAVERRTQRRALAGNAGRGGGARARQVVVDLGAGEADLLGDEAGERAALPPSRRLSRLPPFRLRGGIGEHAERRLQRVREVAGLGTGALDDLGVAHEHGVEFIDQGLDLGREGAFDRPPAAFVHRGQPAVQARQRTQADPHLDQRRRHQAGAKEAEAEHQQTGEARHRLADQAFVGGDDQAQRRLRLFSRAQHLLDHAQRRAIRAVDAVGVLLAVGERIGRHRQRHIPQRTRAQHADRRHRPVDSGPPASTARNTAGRSGGR